MRRILVVNDELSIVTFLIFNLEKEGYRVTNATDGGEGLELALEQSFDFIVLDAMLLMMDGMGITQRLRQEKNEAPILMLTAKDDQVDRTIGLEIGTDDYLTKPSSPREVLARMKVIFRRIEPYKQSEDEAKPEYLSIGRITANLTNRQVTVDDHLIELTPKEFELFVYFMRRKNRVIDRDTLLDRIWNFDFAGRSRTVDVHVSHLRGKIERDPKHPKYLVTIRGLGYKFQESKQ